MKALFSGTLLEGDIALITRNMKAIASPARVQIISLLHKHGEMTVLGLEEMMNGLAQPTISHHLATLARVGMASSRKDGVWRVWSLNPGKIAEVAESLRPPSAR